MSQFILGNFPFEYTKMILSIHIKLSMLKNLSMLEPNFEEADGLGISLKKGL